MGISKSRPIKNWVSLRRNVTPYLITHILLGGGGAFPRTYTEQRYFPLLREHLIHTKVTNMGTNQGKRIDPGF